MPRPPDAFAKLTLADDAHSDFTTDHKDSDWGGGNHGDLGPGHIDMPGFKLTGHEGLPLRARTRTAAAAEHADFMTDHKDSDWGGGNHGDLGPGHIDMAGFKASVLGGAGRPVARAASAAAGEHADFKTDHKDSDWGGTHGDLGPGHIDMAGFKFRRQRRGG